MIKCIVLLMSVSWYGHESGRYTASGQLFDAQALTAAHRTLPFGTRITLTNKQGKSVSVTVNDRGPFVRTRDLDVTEHVAQVLGFQNKGVAVLKACVCNRR